MVSTVKLIIGSLLACSLQAAVTKKTVCASGCDYPNTFTGLSNAAADAMTAQGVTCAPYIIEIKATDSIDIGSNTLILGDKTCNQFITLRSNRMDALPRDGTRIDPVAHGAYLAQIVQSGGSQLTAISIGSLAGLALCQYWRIEGLEIKVTGASNSNPNGYAIAVGHSYELHANHVELKHLWIHGVSGAGNLLYGVGLVAVDNARIADSYFDSIANGGAEAHAVMILYSHGPVDVINNRLSASTQDVLIGGTIMTAGLLPSFMNFTGNLMDKDRNYKTDAPAVLTITAAPPANPMVVTIAAGPCETPFCISGSNAPINPAPVSLAITGATGTGCSILNGNHPITVSGTSVTLTGFNGTGCTAYTASSATASPNPNWACRQGYVYKNLASGRDWICNSSNVWVDQGGVTTNNVMDVKNVWEAKGCRGCTIYGNEFTGFWFPSGQDPAFITLNLATQIATCAFVIPCNEIQPWQTIEDMRIHANKMYNGHTIMLLSYPGGPQGLPCVASPPNGPPCFAYAHNNIYIHNNLGYNLSDERDYHEGGTTDGQFGTGYSQINTGNFEIQAYHNTFLVSTWSAGSGQYYRQGMIYTPSAIAGQIINRDNITPIAKYGILDLSANNYRGACSISQALAAGGGFDARNNIFTTDLAGWTSFSTGSGACVNGSTDWPAGNQPAANGAAVVNTGTDFKAKGIAIGAASDGRDVGANIDFVNWATAGALSGAANPNLEYKIASFNPGSTGVDVYFTAPSVNACTWELSANGNSYASPIAVSSQTRTGRAGKATWAGTLAANTQYYVRSTCDGNKLEYAFPGSHRAAFRTTP